MSSNNSISQIMLNKLEQRKDYIAWYLSQYRKNENLNDEEVTAFLESATNNTERLAMCKAPNSKAPDFMRRINSMADFTNVSPFKLSAIIRKVDSIISLQNSNTPIATSLMAAREKNDKPNGNKE